MWYLFLYRVVYWSFHIAVVDYDGVHFLVIEVIDHQAVLVTVHNAIKFDAIL